MTRFDEVLDNQEEEADRYMAAHPGVDWVTSGVVLELDDESSTEDFRVYRAVGHRTAFPVLPSSPGEWKAFNAFARGRRGVVSE